MTRYQDLSPFRVPPGLPGRGGLGLRLWWRVPATLSGLSICGER